MSELTDYLVAVEERMASWQFPGGLGTLVASQADVPVLLAMVKVVSDMCDKALDWSQPNTQGTLWADHIQVAMEKEMTKYV